MLLSASIFGTACIIAAPVLILSSFVALWRMGRAITAVNPALWDEMKPGVYSDISVTRKHSEALGAFLSTKEYLSLNSASITRLAVIYKVLRNAAVVALGGAVATVFWALSLKS
jgi:hypothetical protein